MPSLEEILQETLQSGRLHRAVLTRPRKDADVRHEKVTVRPVQVKGEVAYQFAMRAGKQETHENLNAAETGRRIAEWCRTQFRDCHLFTADAEFTVRTADDGTANITRTAVAGPTPSSAEHDRPKSYLIPEGTPCGFLVETGVMTPAGNVRAAKRRKFRQINRFLELVDDVVPDLPSEGPLHVIDFGCGKSYLTFALHHLLTVVHQREVELVGLDREESVIRQCRELAEKLQCGGLSFRRQDITDFEGFGAGASVDLVVSLHACDTATDDALAQAVRWNTSVILAVPCCQHEVAAAMNGEHVAGLSRHGILKERFAALATDALRAEVLEQHGYRTQVVEFIDMEHTPKNVLIRAVRRSAPGGTDRTAAVRQLKNLLGIDGFRLEDELSAEP